MNQKIIKIFLALVMALLFQFFPAAFMAKQAIAAKVTFNFIDVDLPIITKFVSDITHKNFILDERVKGKITIIAPAPLDPAETFNLFTAVLEIKGFTVVPSGVETYSIVPASEAKQKGLKFSTKKPAVNASYAAQLIPLKYISAGDVVKLLQPVIAKDGHISAFGPGNLLLVIDSGINITNILSVLNTIDKPMENRSSVNIYFLEHADATELTKVIDTLIRASQAQPRNQPSSSSAFDSLSGISVTADKASNALIIVAAPPDYQNILQIIKKLDKRRRQVFVEMIIAEVSINKLLELGTKWRGAVTHNGEAIFVAGSGTVDSSTINSIVTGLTGLTIGGLSNYFTLPQSFISGATSDVQVPGLAALFSLSDFKDAVNVLSTPQLLTSDNKEAEITVGENVPFPSQRVMDTTTTATSNTVLTSIERRDVGITLKLTPQVSEGDYVKMDIYQEISAVVQGQSDEVVTSLGATFTKRAAKTSVVVKDKQTVVIGGLIQDKDEEVVTKTPFLGDIPFLGWLFKYKSHNKNKTNLLLFLTPHVVNEADQLGRLSQDKLKDFTQKGKSYLDDELMVTFKRDVTEVLARSVIANQQATVIKTLDGNTYHLRLKKGINPEEAADLFSTLPEVQKAEPISRIKIP